MEEKIERLKRKIADLRWRLEQLALDRIQMSGDRDEHMGSSPEHALHELRLYASELEEEVLAARVTALELRLAELTVQAEMERLMKLQPCPSVREIEEHRSRFKQVLARHKESAKQLVEAAVDIDLAIERNDQGITEAPRPEHRQRRKDREYDRDYDGPEHGYEGPQLGR